MIVDANTSHHSLHHDFGIGHLRPVLAVRLVDAIQQSARHDLSAVEPTHDGVCAGELGHGAVKTLVPTVVLRGVAGAATGRRCVALGFLLPRGQGQERLPLGLPSRTGLAKDQAEQDRRYDGQG